MDVLKRHFLESGLNKFLAVCNIGSTLAMTIIFFFSKCLKFNLDSMMESEIEKRFFVFKIIAFK